MLDRKKYAVEIDRGLPTPVRQRHLGDRRHGDSDARIGDQDVQPAEAFFDVGHDFHPARLAGDILMPELCLVTGLLDARDNLRPPEIVDIGDRDRRTFACQQLGNRRTDAGRTAGDQRDLALNLPRHFGFLSLLFFYLMIAGP